MATLVTPSAKAHERISSRWQRDIFAESKRDWLTYYIKLVCGSPIPYLFILFMLSVSLSRAANEMTAWGIAALSIVYIGADLFSRTREFRFFALGGDVLMAIFLIFAMIGIFCSNSFYNSILDVTDNLGKLRWIPLAYFFAYTLELFPDLNRLLTFLFIGITVAAIYGIVQHFVGIDWVRDLNLEFAPVKEHVYFCIRGFQSSSEIFATLLAMTLPLPISAFLLSDKRDSMMIRWGAIALSLLLVLALFWTYRPGLWIAGGLGMIVTLILHKRNQLYFLLTLALFGSAIILSLYSSPANFFDQIRETESTRAVAQRVEINKDLQLFYQSPWIGVGMGAPEIKHLETKSGNLYFELLAETGILGSLAYFVLILYSLLVNYRLWQEIPSSHFWHRSLVSGVLGAQVAFHIAGLYWATLSESFTMNMFAFLLGCIGYIGHHYDNGLVTDDFAL